MNFPNIPTVPVGDVPADAVLLDVREPDEWAAGRAEGALHVPIREVVDRLPEITERAGDGPLYVLCRVGGRSAQVTGYLVQQGIDATNVAGGLQAWAEAGKPLVSDAGEPFVL
ncbi:MULTISPECIES: rhodanese-like domain-containing protein [unclassified Streptomyces]|jgi:rhodanese-related sulfurtransferase|uniref:rhodanese-like domain-containing protein n=1 Tax=Streptomyces TaxID=1883 RepID=UPI0019037074|nr:MULTISPECIES: rhodanese-like domain-containing protein [unclassified Streptomyces]MCU4747806.1 rhodanese-like domain-containing protein [Streptomyces sp. G-5]QQN78427.1 rhodanese-like domain-containing protein [Streptomyces sp. XC 2026]